jgi:hypothetical protein
MNPYFVASASINACQGNYPNPASAYLSIHLLFFCLILDVRSWCECSFGHFSLEYGSQVGQSEREKLPEEETMEQTKIANKDLEFAILGQCLRYFVFLH